MADDTHTKEMISVVVDNAKTGSSKVYESAVVEKFLCPVQNFVQSTEYVIQGSEANDQTLQPKIQLIVNQEIKSQPSKDSSSSVIALGVPQISMTIVSDGCDGTEESSNVDSNSVLKDKPFKCSLCNERFTSKGNLSRHSLVHTVHIQESQDRFTCTECGRHFIQQCDLNRHKQVHTKNQPYKCHLCDNAYLRKSDLSAHVRFHNKQKVFKCEHCSKGFCQSGDLNRHVRTIHLKLKKLSCNLCQRKYVSEKTLLRHTQTAHRDVIINSWTDSNTIQTPTE